MTDVTKTVTRDLLRQHGACYYKEPDGEAKVNALVPPDGLTALDVLALDIPVADRLWVVTLPGVCAPTVLWRWQALFVERALGRVEDPDPRSLAVVTLLRRLGGGEDVPQMERDAARDAALDAAWAAARDAAWDAARAAARAAARDAAWAAARDAEEKQQIADLIVLLTEGAK